MKTFSTPTRPVENVVITTKALQDRNNLLLDGRMVENKGKRTFLSLTNIESIKMSVGERLLKEQMA